jgi:hypothetical protein
MWKLSQGAIGECISLNHGPDLPACLVAGPCEYDFLRHRRYQPLVNAALPKAVQSCWNFGLAKLRAADPKSAPVTVSAAPTDANALTMQGTILGTLQYMSPEQLEGTDADARTDIFAFGTTFYEMVTGKKAFESNVTCH